LIEISEALTLFDELKKRQAHAINTYVPTELEEHNQLDYHKSKARIRLLFGGNQSGKSHAAAYDCACNARGRNPHNDRFNNLNRDAYIWIIAPEYALIKSGIYRHLRNILPQWDIVEEGSKIPNTNLPSFIKVRRKDNYITIIEFLSAKGDNRAKFQAAAVDLFYIDEEIPGDLWEELEARTLATGGTYSISATLVESYDWILDLEKIAEREVEQNVDNPSVFLTRLNTEFNRYLDSTTVEYLKSKWSQETLEYRFYGKARRLTGLIYNTFDKSKHLIAPFRIPYDWPRWCAIDPGIRTCAALWIAIGPKQEAYAYRELYAHNEPLWRVAIEIKKLERWHLDDHMTKTLNHYVWEPTDETEHLVYRIIDPKAKARSEAGEESIISQLHSKFGLLCVEADNSIRAGIEDCRLWLEEGFKVFSTLDNFLDERRSYRLPSLKKRKDQPEARDKPIAKKNHLMDCWRYIARMSPRWEDRIMLPHIKQKESDVRSEREYEDEYLGCEV
jgi:hypothetical protein